MCAMSANGACGRMSNFRKSKLLIPRSSAMKQILSSTPQVVADRIVRYSRVVGTGKRHRRHGLWIWRPCPPANRQGET